ncbi:MAG TPA: STAS domain-containing protein [Actinomycetota bacterium]
MRTFRLSGRLDLTSVDRAADLLCLAIGTPGDVWLDLSGLEFIDTFGIRFLLEFAKVLEDGTLHLASPPANVERILRLMGLNERRGPVRLAPSLARSA